MKVLLVSLLIFFISSCAIKSRKLPPTKAPASGQALLIKANSAYEKNRFKTALKLTDQILINFKDSDVIDDAYILRGDIFDKKNDYTKSYEAYIKVVQSPFYSPFEAEAMYRSARSLVKLFRYPEALSLCEKLIDKDKVKDSLLANTYILMNMIYLNQGDNLEALKSLNALINLNLKPTQKQKYQLKAIELLNTKLNMEQLETVISKSSFGDLRAFAYYKLGMAYYEKKNFSTAVSYLNSALEILPNASFSENAQERLNQLLSRNRVNPTTIGVILPLSGKYKRTAQKVLRGLQLGLGIYGPSRSQFSLAIMDSQQNPDVSRRAVNQLVAQDNVIAIVGSLLSKTSVSVATKSEELGIPNISLSQKPGLTHIGNYVFRNTITAEMQVKHLVKEAIQKRKLKRFAVLFPNDPYGVEYTNLFWDEVLAQGGEIVGAQSYPPKETNFSGPLSRLIGTFYYEDRMEEYNYLLKDWYKKQKYINSRTTPPSDLLPPQIHFDALFIPDSTRALGQISPTLAYHDIEDIQIIGTNLWNHQSFLKRAGKFSEKSFFVDVLLAKDKEFKRTEFYDLYKKTFRAEPSIFEAQAYDIGLILRQLIISGARTRMDLAKDLNGIYQFNGSFGELKINNMREIIRPLFTLEVKNNNIKKVK